MSVKRGIAVSFANKGTAFVIQFGSSMVLARLLLPSEIGLFSVAMAFLAILHGLRDFGIGRYLIQEKDLTDAKIRTVFGSAICISWGLALAVLALREPIAGIYGEPDLAELMELLSINFVLLPFGQPAIALLRRDRRYGQLAVVNLTTTAIGASVSVLFAAWHYGPTALAYGSIAGSVTTVVLALAFRPDHVTMLPSLSAWRSVWRFGLYGSSESILTRAGQGAPELIIGGFLGFAPVGFFSRAQGLGRMLDVFLVGAFRWVIGPEIGALHRKAAGLTRLVPKITDLTLVIAWPLLAFMFFKAETVIWVLFGENWLPAAPILQALCVARAVGMLISVAPSVYDGTGAVRLQFRNQMIIEAASVTLLLLGAMHSLAAVAWLRVPYELVVVAVHLSVMRRYANIGLRLLLRDSAQAAGVTAVFTVVIALLHWLSPAPTQSLQDVIVLAGEVVVLCSLYWFLLKRFRHPLRGYVLESFRVIMRKT